MVTSDKIELMIDKDICAGKQMIRLFLGLPRASCGERFKEVRHKSTGLRREAHGKVRRIFEDLRLPLQVIAGIN
jgi:hypothetical protein